MPRKLTQEEFIRRAKLVHDNKYDYSLVEYNHSKEKIKIICPIHGRFEQIAGEHLRCGCNKCGHDIVSSKNKILISGFIKRSNIVHNNKYDYSLVEYKHNNIKVKIICPIHGPFEQTPRSHLAGHECNKCGRNETICKMRMTTEEFVNRSNKIHNNKYDYSLVDYKNSYINVKIICPIHGVFEQTPNHHLFDHGCPKCNQSKGELTIEKCLESHGYNFIQQKRFHNCRYIRPLPFDFYLPKYNLCVEYDGEQHYKIVKYWGGKKTFVQNKRNDKIKNTYCRKNNIKLYRITYKDNIEEKMKELINSLSQYQTCCHSP